MKSSLLKNSLVRQLTTLLLSISFAYATHSSAATGLPVGININAVNYYSPAVAFNDLAKSASEMLAYPHGTGVWDSGKMDQLPVDANGWPLQLPSTIDGTPQAVRFLINNQYAGEYVVRYDGEGAINFVGESQLVDGELHITLPGDGGNVWFNITASTEGNNLRNMRIIPVSFANSEASMPTFRTDFIQGLQPFGVLRFLDFAEINNSTQAHWSERNTINTRTQGNGKGVAWEHMIELCNQLDADAWLLVPHMASDDYLTKLARLFRDRLDPGRKLYIEFSNEVWNWQFTQSNYVLDNAPGHPDAYVSADLAAINPASADHPEKDAYMMARVFRIFSAEWGSQKSRLVRVATGQHAWIDNSRRILEYLFTTDGNGADALSVGGYFNYDAADHDTWVAMNPNDVTAEMILQSAATSMPAKENTWTRDSAAYAAQFGIDYIVYEGGQHMQPYQQTEWAYNQAVYDAQIHPGMYELYMQNFAVHMEPEVNTQLFMAYSFMGKREQKWGSWGHLENLDQIGRPDLVSIAPKYQALLDINTSTPPTADCGSYTLPNSQWRQISLPCDPGQSNTVNDVLGDDGLGTYTTDWSLFRFDASSNAYVQPAITDSLEQGVGYWIVQNSGSSKTLDVPAGSVPTPVTETAVCPAGVDGCFEIPLGTRSNTTQWNLIGHPFNNSQPLAGVQIANTSSDCSDGCALDTDQAASIINTVLWTYDGSAYSEITTAGTLNAWTGYWLSSQSAAHGTDPRLIIPRP